MKQVIRNTIIISIVSFILVWIISFNAQTDENYIINILIVFLIHTSVIISLLLKKK
jgi:hypothetical protein